ncbi:MDR family oxidoreductase [Phytohalomonas tamaricis]|uniref:MDR family oxidoreductase n=1 Tax=Phytohalomonas tamaricis TaxID=2081032 RepID=UPI000D0AC066|nr:MDR family oxidoreductase [Phytohalomonas tamaricis]
MPRVLMLRDDTPPARIETLDDNDLPQLGVTLDIDFSTLNYKDALAITGAGKIVRNFPMVGGIDAVGTVAHSNDARYASGQRVIVTGWGVGERYWGGFAERQRFDPDWLVPCPDPLSPRQAMLLGTAGFTAMLALIRLEKAGLTPSAGPIVVTGATGGVGCWAIQLLAQQGFEVHAVTGKPDKAQWLKTLGAHTLIDRHEFIAKVRALDKAQWAGGVDNVGSSTLAALLSRTQDNGCVAAVGLAGGMDLPTSVAPFILRGVSLLGVNSVTVPYAPRLEAWERLATLPEAMFEAIETETIGLDALPDKARAMVDGKTHGKVLIDPHR